MLNQTVTIIGGCGHVGLPLGLVCADVGMRIHLLDCNQAAISKVQLGVMPFEEKGLKTVR
jgi:UDP-N-acetyl-D-mannosaminuronic acid dehydrogenase